MEVFNNSLTSVQVSNFLQLCSFYCKSVKGKHNLSNKNILLVCNFIFPKETDLTDQTLNLNFKDFGTGFQMKVELCVSR